VVTFHPSSRSWYMSCFWRHSEQSTAPSIKSSKDTWGNSRSHPEVTFNSESFSRTLNQFGVILQSGGRSLYNVNPPQALSLLRWLQLSGKIPAIHRFNYAVRSSHVQTLQHPYINAGCYRRWQISLHNNPNNQVTRSMLLRENHNVQIMQLWRSEIFTPSFTTPTGIFTSWSP